MLSPSYLQVRIVAIISETADTKSFVLEELNGNRIFYKPGQFLTLIFQKHSGEERRSYSISSSPDLDEPLTITVKRIDNGEFSRFLFDQVKPGDILYTIGASGFFTWPGNHSSFTKAFFFAAGSGITPILPLIKHILHKDAEVVTYLMYSNRAVGSTIFKDKLDALHQQFPSRFHPTYLFSTAQDLMKARLSKLLLAQYLNHHIPHFKNDALFYLCGPHDYMQMISITLLTEGVHSDNIRKEIFDTFKPVIKEQPSDREPHLVTVRVGEQAHQLVVQYPLTILQAAKRNGIHLPYSCEAGKCGTCSATCVKGKVWMSYNEVLLDKEVAKGRVLTCTGYPVGGDVVLEFPEAQ
jgi:ring-1,2-phenylacetyl-CoA epoxidase subunit PaaE